MILVGDVGGTTTDLALLDERLTVHTIRSFASQEYNSLYDIVQEFLRTQSEAVTHACFGIAGAVRARSVRTTNLPWLIEAGRLAHLIGVADVLLINDIEAIGYGSPPSTTAHS